MYKFENGQISIHKFGQPIGMKLHADNRWVKKAMTIPWDAIERRYAALKQHFKSKKLRICNTSAGTKPTMTASRPLLHH